MANAELTATAEALDAIEETLDIIENNAPAIIREHKTLIYTSIALVSAAIGTTVSVFIIKKRLTAKYDQLLQDEIEQAREFYAIKSKSGEYSDPVKLAEKYEPTEKDMETLREIATSYQSTDIAEARAVVESGNQVIHDRNDGVHNPALMEKGKEAAVLSEQVINIFTESETPGGFNYEEELKHRTEEEPYIISYDEWSENETDYEQSTLTFYEGDDVLIDSEDKPINETDDVVGDSNLLKFGHGSKDNNVVYIPNDRLELEFEVIRNKGKYTSEVLGFIDTESLEHSARDRRPRRFRTYDD